MTILDIILIINRMNYGYLILGFALLGLFSLIGSIMFLIKLLRTRQDP